MPRARMCVFITILVTLLILSLVPLVYAQPVTNSKTGIFTDVDQSHPNRAYINYLTGKGIISGFPDGTYRPGESLTRAQAAGVMVKAMGLSTDGMTETSFTDVPASHWAISAIGAAEKAGLIKGFPDGTFRPNDILTRAQSVALILRLSGQPLPETPLPGPVDLGPEHWAVGPVAVALDAGLVDLQDNRFSPNESFTRSDLARALSIAITLSPITRTQPLNGELVFKKGIVKVKKAGESDFRSVSERIIVAPGDSIHTEANSSAEILFPDGSGLLLNPNVKMTIKDTRGLAYIKKSGVPGNAVDWLNIDLQRGKVYIFLASVIPTTQSAPAMSNKPLLLASAFQADWVQMYAAQTKEKEEVPWWKEPSQKKVKVQVDMPWCVAGVRGSAGSFEVNEDGSGSVSNLTGEFFMTSGTAHADLEPGQSAASNAPGEVSKDDMTPEQLADFLQEGVSTFLENQANVASENQAVQQTEQQHSVQQALQQAQQQVNQSVAGQPTQSTQSSGGSTTTPVAISNLSDVTITSSEVITLTVNTNPADAVISAVSSSTNVATVSVTGNVITITGKDPDTATITVTASKSGYGSRQTAFKVTVIAHGSISGVVQDAINNYALSDVTVSLFDNYRSDYIAQATTDDHGRYVFDKVTVGSGYKIEYCIVGYLTETYENITIEANTTSHLQTVKLQTAEQQISAGSIQGFVSNALTGEVISGITIYFRRGINVTSGLIVATVNETGSNGAYTVDDLEAGSYTGEIIGENYITAYFTAVCLSGTINTEQNGTVTPVLPDDETRIVLTWGEAPRDLDAHLTGPTPEGGRFHVAWNNRLYEYNVDEEWVTYVELDVDNTYSFGPETITIYRQSEGVYLYYVYNYSQESELSESGAQVKVYKGNELVVMFNVPINQEGTWWSVFKLSGDTITPINRLSDQLVDMVSFSMERILASSTDGAVNVLTIAGDTFIEVTHEPEVHYTVMGLPPGVTATLVRVSERQAELYLSGTPIQPFNQDAQVEVIIKAPAVTGGHDLPPAVFIIGQETVMQMETLDGLEKDKMGKYGLIGLRP